MHIHVDYTQTHEKMLVDIHLHCQSQFQKRYLLFCTHHPLTLMLTFISEAYECIQQESFPNAAQTSDMNTMEKTKMLLIGRQELYFHINVLQYNPAYFEQLLFVPSYPHILTRIIIEFLKENLSTFFAESFLFQIYAFSFLIYTFSF